MPEHLEPAVGVELGRLVELVGDALQPRQQDQKAERRPLPDVEQGHGTARRPDARHPGDADAEQRVQADVDRAVVGVDDPAEIAQAHRGREQGQQQQRAHEAAQPELAVDQQRQGEPEQDLGGHGDDGVAEREGQRPPHPVVAEQARPALEAHELERPPHAARLLQAEPERVAEREQGEAAGPDHRRQDEPGLGAEQAVEERPARGRQPLDGQAARDGAAHCSPLERA